MKRFLVIVLLTLFSISAVSAAQVSPSQRKRTLDIAQRMLREGKTDEALRMLENLYRQMPDDTLVVITYADALYRIKGIHDAKEILKSYIVSHPDDFYLRSRTAILYLLEGDRDGFIKQIDDMIAEFRGNRQAYEMAADVLEEVDELEKLLDIVSEGRKALADSTFLADIAASACFATGRFMRGTREYLLMSLSKDQKPEEISRRITNKAKNPEARSAIIKALENARSASQYRRVVDQSLPYIYLLDGRCDLAFGAMMDAIDRFPDIAISLIDFSRELQNHGCFSECAKAYDVAARQPQLSSKIPDILMAKAMCEKLSGDLKSAKQSYHQVADMFAKTEMGEIARIERVRILKEMGDVESALKEATLLEEKSRSTLGKAQAILLKGECLLILGDLDGAAKTYDKVELDWQDSLAQEAFFNLGEIAFFRGNFEEAVSYYNLTARQFPRENRANDAIERLMLIKESKTELGYHQDLKTLADAFLLERQGKIDEAKNIYSLVSGATLKPIKTQALKRLAEIARRQGEFDKAIALYKVIGDSMGGDLTPNAMEAIGDVYCQSGQVELAIEAYENLIVQFPESISAREARRKIDAIKAKSKSGF